MGLEFETRPRSNWENCFVHKFLFVNDQSLIAAPTKNKEFSKKKKKKKWQIFNDQSKQETLTGLTETSGYFHDTFIAGERPTFRIPVQYFTNTESLPRA